jgi:hypothetical protein
VHESFCANCGTDTDYSFGQSMRRKTGRVLCVECSRKLDVNAPDPYYCAECERSSKQEVVPEGIARISLQRFGAVYCQPCGKAKVKLEKAGVAIS